MNPFQAFLAARAAKATQPVTNDADKPVTREEFNLLSRAVAALIEDVDTATSPAKLTSAINSALDTAMKDMKVNGGGRPPLALKDDRGFTAPADDADGDTPPRTLSNATPRQRKPLALKADGPFTPPAGE